QQRPCRGLGEGLVEQPLGVAGFAAVAGVGAGPGGVVDSVHDAAVGVLVDAVAPGGEQACGVASDDLVGLEEGHRVVGADARGQCVPALVGGGDHHGGPGRAGLVDVGDGAVEVLLRPGI